MICEKCGIEVIHCSTRKVRCGHIALREPVVHPWYAEAVGLLLGIPSVAMETAPARREAGFRTRVGAMALRACDYYAYQVSQQYQASKLFPYREQARRDRAIVELAAWLSARNP